MSEVCEVIVTAPEYGWMTGFVRKLVQDRLIASGNIVTGVESIYRWQGEIVERTEVIGLLHTRRTLVQQVVQRVNAEHPYELPGIRIGILQTTSEYAQWVHEATKRQPRH